MGVGKYSPTISFSYSMDQTWWRRNGGGYENGINPQSENDNDGYDSYGYSGNGSGPDRAGYTELDYERDFEYDEEEETVSYPLYQRISRECKGKLLGDLNDYLPVQGVLESLGLSANTMRLYGEQVLKDVTGIINGGSFIPNLYVHKDSVRTIIDNVAKYNLKNK